MLGLENLSTAEIHVHAAGQARDQSSHGAHNVDTFELIGTVLLEDGSYSAPHLSYDRACRKYPADWHSMVSEDTDDNWRSCFADHHMMRKNASDCFVKATADGLFRHFEIRPGLGLAGVKLFHRSLRRSKSAHPAA